MIKIDTDLYLLTRLFNISPGKVANEYSGMSVEEIMEAEAAQGNAAAANFDKEILSDPVKLIELFKLRDPANKYEILSNMNEDDLKNIMPLLDKSDLAAGLNFFTKDKILDMMNDLPKDQLLKMVFEMMAPDKIMAQMPDDEINKVLQSPGLNKNLEKKCLQPMKAGVFIQMLEATYGQSITDILQKFGVQDQSAQAGAAGGQDPFQKGYTMSMNGNINIDPKILYDLICNQPDDKFQESLLNMPPTNKQYFAYMMAQEDPKIYELFDSKAYTNIIGAKKEKSDILKASQVLDPENIVKMTNQLPRDLMAVVTTQIDTSKFADVLLANFKNILSQIVAA